MPQFKVWPCGDNPESAVEVRADNRREAVTFWADRRDAHVSPERAIAHGIEMEVYVHDLVSGDITHWFVAGQVIRSYVATSQVQGVQIRAVEKETGERLVCPNCPCNTFYDLEEGLVGCSGCSAQLQVAEAE